MLLNSIWALFYFNLPRTSVSTLVVANICVLTKQHLPTWNTEWGKCGKSVRNIILRVAWACNFPICLIASLFASSRQFYCGTTNEKLVLRRGFYPLRHNTNHFWNSNWVISWLCCPELLSNEFSILHFSIFRISCIKCISKCVTYFRHSAWATLAIKFTYSNRICMLHLCVWVFDVAPRMPTPTH